MILVARGEWADTARAAEQHLIRQIEDGSSDGYIEVRFSDDSLVLVPIAPNEHSWSMSVKYSETRDQYRATAAKETSRR